MTPTSPVKAREMGRDRLRVDAREKVTGRAGYAFEQPGEQVLYAALVQSEIARGRVRSVNADDALALDGVRAVLDHTNAPRLHGDDRELLVLQDDAVGFRRQVVAVAVADTPEQAGHAAALVRVGYDVEEHEAQMSAGDHRLDTPETVNAGYETDTEVGDVDAGLTGSAVVVAERYSTPLEHNNPMEPHAVVAVWHDGPDRATLTLWSSTQSVYGVRSTVATLVDLDEEQVRVAAPYVGGGFGSKGLPHAHDAVAVLVAKAFPGRTVKVALTRQQMFALAGYRTPTVQDITLGADPDGRLRAVEHAVVEQTSRIKEFAEQTAVPTRMMYGAPAIRTRHRLDRLDVAVPSWMRAPGEMPGMYGLESAMDELAWACGLDPIELRRRNEPTHEPESGKPFSDRRLVDCFEVGAEHFGWWERVPEARSTRSGHWWVGLGTASATYPAMTQLRNTARVTHTGAGRFTVAIAATDIGTGAWTVLGQIAADALGCGVDAVTMQIGDSDLPKATVAGGSSGTSSWGSAIATAAQRFREEHGDHPADGASTTADAADNPDLQRYALHSFGAHFVEARVHAFTGEVRVSRMLGVFSPGRVINPRTARSQLIGGMTMGIGSALHEQSVRDPRFGHVVTQDLATYHVPACADVLDVDAIWLEGPDEHVNPMGARGIGEIGIVGAAAAVVNAVYHATGIRVRDLPVTPAKLVGGLGPG